MTPDSEMTGYECPVTAVTIETPSGFVGESTHDVTGRGQLHFEGDRLEMLVRHHRLGGLLAGDEQRSFRVAEITGWEVCGGVVEFTAGAISIDDGPVGMAVNEGPVGGLLASNGASVPLHICTFTCPSDDSARSLTDRVIAAGLDPARVSHRASS